MVQIAGKYQLTGSKNFYEMLLKIGVPEGEAKKRSDAKSVLQVELDGKKLKLISDSQVDNNVSELVLGEEVDEKMPTHTVKSTSELKGNVITIKSKTAEGNEGKRILTFSDTGLEIEIDAGKDDIPIAKRTYKRI